MRKRRLICVMSLVVLACALAEPAQASLVYRESEGVGFTNIVEGRPGETNDVSIAYDPAARVYVIKDAAGITLMEEEDPDYEFASHCVRRSPTVVACRWPKILVMLGDGNDRVEVTTAAGPAIVSVKRERGATSVGPDGGKDYVVRASRGVRADGGTGNDVLVGHDGADVLSGGTGHDTLVGGGGPDALYGADGNDRLDSGPGDDIAAGLGGNDRIDGGAGADNLEYTPGMNLSTVSLPSIGADRLSSGSGNDQIFSGMGRDVIDAGAGADRVFTIELQVRGPRRQDPSTIVCGAGIDVIEPDRGDVASGCERVVVGPAATRFQPPLYDLCSHRCVDGMSLQADLGRGKTAMVARASAEGAGAVITLGQRVRALLQKRVKLRVRVHLTYGRSLVLVDWFVLKR